KNGQMIAGETDGYVAKLVILPTRAEVLFRNAHKVHFTALAFSPLGRLLASSSYDGDACLWDIRTGQLVHRLRGHKQGVLSIAFSPDGATLVSGGFHGDIKLWNVATSK